MCSASLSRSVRVRGTPLDAVAQGAGVGVASSASQRPGAGGEGVPSPRVPGSCRRRPCATAPRCAGSRPRGRRRQGGRAVHSALLVRRDRTAGEIVQPLAPALASPRVERGECSSRKLLRAAGAPGAGVHHGRAIAGAGGAGGTRPPAAAAARRRGTASAGDGRWPRRQPRPTAGGELDRASFSSSRGRPEGGESTPSILPVGGGSEDPPRHMACRFVCSGRNRNLTKASTGCRFHRSGDRLSRDSASRQRALLLLICLSLPAAAASPGQGTFGESAEGASASIPPEYAAVVNSSSTATRGKCPVAGRITPGRVGLEPKL